MNDKLFQTFLFDLLVGTIIIYHESFKSAIPPRYFQAIKMEKLLAHLKKDNLATYSEVAVYLYTASLAQPLSSNWTDIYCYVGCKSEEINFGKNIWNELCPSQSINEDQQRELQRLRRWIFDQRMKYAEKESRKTQTHSKRKNEQFQF